MGKNLVEAEVFHMPKCDIHQKRHDAQYDCSVSLVGGRTWAYICEEIFQDPAYRAALGTGKGQKLILVRGEE